MSASARVERTEAAAGAARAPALDLDAVLAREAGPFGRFQRRLLALAALLGAAGGAGAAEYVFTTARTRARCLIPECEVASSAEFSPPWLVHAVPANAAGAGAGALGSCQRYAPRARNATGAAGNATDSCRAALFDPTVIEDCQQYVYEDTDTVVSDLELACEEWLRSVAGSARVAGFLVALPLTGLLADWRGRRTALVAAAACTACLGAARAAARSYTAFIVGQFLETMLGAGSFTCIYILVQELVGPKYRVFAGVTGNCANSVGHVAAALLAWRVRYWRHLTLAIFLPQLLFLSYYWLVPESIRWYQSKGKFDKVEEAIKRLARVNGKSLSEKTILELKSLSEAKASEDIKGDEPWLIVEVFRHKPILLRCIIVPVWWMTATFVYYGMSINAVNMAGNKYVNYALVAAVEIPGFYVGMALMQRAGRRPALAAGFWLSALCQLAYIFLPKNMLEVSLVAYLAGKSSISLVATTLYVYTAELFPTRRRHTLFAFCSMMGRLGAVLAPLTPALGVTVSEWLPFALFGGTAALAGLLVLAAPETRGARLPDTMRQAARLGKGSAAPTDTALSSNWISNNVLRKNSVVY